MSIAGRMSVFIRLVERTPKMAISVQRTAMVYGRRRARRTIHMGPILRRAAASMRSRIRNVLEWARARGAQRPDADESSPPAPAHHRRVPDLDGGGPVFPRTVRGDPRVSGAALAARLDRGQRLAVGALHPRACGTCTATGDGSSYSPPKAAARWRWSSFPCARRPMGERLRAAIVEDEPPARAGLRALLALDPEVEVVAECSTVDEALAALPKTRADLLFLDVQLARRTGFDLLAALGPARPPAVLPRRYRRRRFLQLDGGGGISAGGPAQDQRRGR